MRVLTVSRRAAAALVVSFAVAGTGPAGEIFGYNTATPASHETYDIFSAEYGFANPVRNASPTFVAAGLNLTGLGYGRTADQAATLISPQHFLMAAHVAQGGNTPTEVRFIGSDNVLRTYSVATTFELPTGAFNGNNPPNQTSDVLIGTLTNPIPAADLNFIRPFRVAHDPTFNYADPVPPVNTFTSRPILASGINFNYANPFANNVVSPVIGTNVVMQGPFLDQDDATHSTVVFNYDYTSIPGEFHAQVGDSGFPSLLSVGGEAVLLGIHYNVSPPLTGTTSLDAFIPYYVPAINAVIGPTYSVGLVPIPEPSSVLAVSSFAAVAYRRLRRRFK